MIVWNLCLILAGIIGGSHEASITNESNNATPTDAVDRIDLPTTLNHVQTDDRRPLYNIAHMCNSIKKTLLMLARGANAVEVDVTFKDDDIYLYHGYPCDCFRYCWDMESLDKYLMFVKKLTTPGYIDYEPRFVILYFDLKLRNMSPDEKYLQGVRFANHLGTYFFGDQNQVQSTLKLVASISYTEDVDFLIALIRSLRKSNLYDQVKDRIGFDVGMDTNQENIRDMWAKLNVTNVWQGDGITNCVNPIASNRLEKLAFERDGPDSYVQKIYRWTIDLTDQIKSLLRNNVDGIMTNHPERVVKIIHENPEFYRSYRLASIHDDPFARFTSPHPPKWRNQANKPSGRDRFLAFSEDIRRSFMHFLYEIWHSIF